jgi:hypothetical protein
LEGLVSGKEALQELKSEIDASRTRIRSIIEKSTNDDMLYQYNVQLYPLSYGANKENSTKTSNTEVDHE